MRNGVQTIRTAEYDSRENGKGEGEKENVAQNAKDILPDDSRGMVPVMFDFARREKFSRLQTVV